MDSNLLPVFAIAVIFIILLIMFIFFLPQLIRSRRMRNLANQFGLSFQSKITKSEWLYPERSIYKRNIIKGVLNSHQIEIYDNNEVLGFGGDVVIKRKTVFNVDAQKEELTAVIDLLWFPSVSSIRRRLLALK